MSPVSSPPNRSIGIVRFGCGLTLLAVSLSVGCSRFGLQNDELGLAPPLEMTKKPPQAADDTGLFAVTDQGREIERGFMNRRRSIWMSE